MAVAGVPDGFLEGEQDEDQQRAILELLTRAYWMEIETVMNYIAASIGQDGGGGLAVRTALKEGVEEEVEHARALGRRIQELHGVVPDDGGLAAGEEQRQPLGRQTDVTSTIEAVVATETSAIRHYLRIMHLSARFDADTSALALNILRDEQRHLRLFEGYLRELRSGS
ncbi:MAG TPA: ferritin-like domain-containing protein [Solirubrobacteraceae bacterium]|jgi:bacterioferritin|nr:ferritin-like domain-containing protein [Solirubrobacteraceae bacterium]